LATEFWRSDSPGDVALKLTPGGAGRLEVYLNGEKIFDRKEDGGFPDLSKVTELKMTIAEKLFQVEEAEAAS
jgi:selT/selW/selH-like putative selenoprotein